jgi:hypothetical protein
VPLYPQDRRAIDPEIFGHLALTPPEPLAKSFEIDCVFHAATVRHTTATRQDG